MNLFFNLIVISFLLGWCQPVAGQSSYQYAIDLNKIQNDQLDVELVVPQVKEKSIVFSFAKIVPGTYAISDFGRFMKDIKAFDKDGKPLPIVQLNENQWHIRNASRLHKIVYKVHDISASTLPNQVVSMAATIFEKGDHMVLNTPGIFGYLEGFRELPIHIQIKKPEALYASTGLQAQSTSLDKDVFSVSSVDELYDSPIMYTKPDTMTIKVGNCTVLLSVYSPNRLFSSKVIGAWMQPLLEAARGYLGGKLPKDKYAFLYYFKDTTVKHALPANNSNNILEHGTSSYWYMQEKDSGSLKNFLIGISIHEFFHMVTPFTVSTRQLQRFNFNTPDLSKHLWLYEGGAVYMASHVRAKYGMVDALDFLNGLSQRITVSKTRFIDTLPLTEIGMHSAGKWKLQYTNVYQKGVLVVACLDLYLLHLSNGRYGFRDLMYDLGKRLKHKPPIEDNDLFALMGEMSFPEIKHFLDQYVGGSNPIPYKDFFALAGIDMDTENNKLSFVSNSNEDQKTVRNAWLQVEKMP